MRKPELILPGYFEQRARTGDVLAYSGRCIFSRAIQFKTKCDISHVGIVLKLRGNLYCLEATSGGAVESPLPSSLRDYEGHLYWLPLGKGTRSVAREEAMESYGASLVGKPYDWKQVFKSGMDILEAFGFATTLNEEDLAKLFCSELVASVLEAGGVMSEVNASEMTPRDIIKLPLYRKAYPLTAGAPDLSVGIDELGDVNEDSG